MKIIAALLSTVLIGLAHAQPYAADVTTVNYTDPYDNDFSLTGYVSIPSQAMDATSRQAGGGGSPAVVIVPDWTNVDEYEQIRATMLNKEFGWVGFAADVYGTDNQGDIMNNMTFRREQVGLYRGNNTLFYGRIQAAVDLMKEHPAVDPTKIAVIGYCFGGTGILTYSFLGATDVVGAVSFHGGLTDFPVDGPVNHPVLVLSGGDDDTGTQVDALEATLNMANATWQITRYSKIEHAFTKWDDDRYNERADSRSWHEMATFLKERFGELSYDNSPPATAVEPVQYDDHGFNLTGFLAVPDTAEPDKTPAVVVVPDWDGTSGVDGYEAMRATMLADMGYVGFVADIYGSDMEYVQDFQKRVEQTTLYRTNYTLFVSRIQAAVDLIAEHELVNADEIFVIGYCFGGTGVVNYAFAGLEKVKAVVPLHGGLTSLAPVETDEVYPYVLVLSGGIDDAHGNNTELEMTLDAANATWEITRWSNVDHGFTEWGAAAYNAMADWRSWDAMKDVFEAYLTGEEWTHDGHSHSHDDDTPTSSAASMFLGQAVVALVAATVLM